MSVFDGSPVLSDSTMLGACFPASKKSNTLGRLGKRNQTTYKEKTNHQLCRETYAEEICQGGNRGVTSTSEEVCQSSQHHIPEVETASGFLAPGAQDCCCAQGVLVLTAQERSRSAKLLLQAGTALVPAVECVFSVRRSITGTASAKKEVAR